ncbi:MULTISPECIES: phosphoglucomutase/phosphomannomutase family protein [Caldisericum]|jgi:phosphomannomutase|uniref:phosphoglucomutase/phosphomannomutase family protein n=1 Tax=Caldisericum TaxID=693074 RepID=UPI003C776EF1
MPIKFGTSGWRGIIADDFTFENVRLASTAIANYLKEIDAKSIVVGYDTRFMSEDFAKSVASVIAAHGINVHFSQYDIPTPVVAFEILDKKASGGINITASHNDYMYNGLKFSNKTGGPALPEETKRIEEIINQIKENKEKILSIEFNEAVSKGIISIFDKTNYFENLKKLVDFEKIKERHLKVVYEPFFGTGRRFLPPLVKDITDFEMIHGERDPLFGKLHPEPIEENLKQLKEAVLNQRANVGLSTDGDADRFGFIDSDGSFISPNIILSIIYYYLLDVRQLKGNVVRTISTTTLLDRIAKAYGFEAIVTPVGFKYIGEALFEKRAIFGGEESGGASIQGWLQEKDGIFVNTLVLEIISHYKKSLRELRNKLFEKFGAVYNKRIDFSFSKELQGKIMNLLKSYILQNKDFLSIKNINELDGLQISLEDGSTILFRLSGTEPKTRIYLEAYSEEKLDELSNFAIQIFNKAGGLSEN